MLEKIFYEFISHAIDRKLPIEGIAIGDEKQLLLHHRFTPDLSRNIYSHTKSYMSTAVGIAIDEGKLSLEDRLVDFFPESLPSDPDPMLKEIRLKNLLTMSSGFNKGYLMGADRRQGIGYPDYMQYMLSRPMEKRPGESFAYSTADSILAGRMVEKATGMALSAYLYEKVFKPLDQGFPIWENDPQGHPIGGGGMYMTLTDMMKIGQVYLADGLWKGKRIVSRDWVKQASSKQIETNGGNIWDCGYGYQFWMSPYPGAYRADGAYGQISMVLPEKGLVVAFQCPEIGDFETVRQAVHEELILKL